jgi:radical SAM protein with 4Fe4S-binding SPASM domain
MSSKVFDYLKLRVLSFYHEALMLKEGHMPAPRMAILYPTYACNHRCIGCDYSELNQRGKSLSPAEMDHVIDELLAIGIRSIEFCGGGEPTLHPTLPAVIDRLVEHGVAFGLLTNGTNLTDELIEQLVLHGSYCRVSVEAASRRIFDIYKQPSSGKTGFDAVIDGIAGLVAARNGSSAPHALQISYKYSVDMNNFEDVLPAVALADSLQVDSIQFKCIRNVPSEIRDDRLIARLQKEIADARLLHSRLPILENLGKSSLTKCRCWLSPLQLTVDPYGDVFICCYYRHRRERHRLGNLFERRLQEIWYSQEHWQKIKQIDVEECNRYDCRFHAYNELMHEFVVEDEGQFAFI